MDHAIDWVTSLREQLPVVQRFNYLNSGTAGPIPTASAEAINAEADYELREGRGSFATWGRLFALLGRSRQVAARAMGADWSEVALTHHSSDGVNIVLWGLEWQPGDEVVTTTLEHDAVAVPLGLLRSRRGVDLRFADIGAGERAVEAIEAALSERTRLVVISHVAFSSGAELPLDRLVPLCKAAEVPLLVDGAQTCGARPVDVHALGVDYYTLSGQKWLCGPEGTGALYVRRDRIESLQCTFASYFSSRKHDFRGNLELHDSAQRFEMGTVYRPGWAGFEASVRWLLDDVGLDRAWTRSLELAQRARAQLASIPGVTLVTPADQATQLLSFDLPAFSPAQLWSIADELARRDRIVMRSTPARPYALRASFGWFNTEQEVDAMVEAVAAFAASGPEEVSVSGYAATLPQHR